MMGPDDEEVGVHPFRELDDCLGGIFRFEDLALRGNAFETKIVESSLHVFGACMAHLVEGESNDSNIGGCGDGEIDDMGEGDS
jgi:hypothetical protein